MRRPAVRIATGSPEEHRRINPNHDPANGIRRAVVTAEVDHERACCRWLVDVRLMPGRCVPFDLSIPMQVAGVGDKLSEALLAAAIAAEEAGL